LKELGLFSCLKVDFCIRCSLKKIMNKTLFIIIKANF